MVDLGFQVRLAAYKDDACSGGELVRFVWRIRCLGAYLGLAGPVRLAKLRLAGR